MDAAWHVQDSSSPYQWHTYRYSPLLAYLMLPNVTWSPNLGKLLFVLCDVAAGFLIYSILKREAGSAAAAAARESTARLSACLWLYNPLVMNVSTRGSAESVVVTLVLLTIHLYQQVSYQLHCTDSVKRFSIRPAPMQKVYILTGLVYGLAVHMKIYPIIYCLTLYLPLASGLGWRSLLEVSTPRLRLVTATLLTLTLTLLLPVRTQLPGTHLPPPYRQDTSKYKFFCLWLRLQKDLMSVRLFVRSSIHPNESIWNVKPVVLTIM